MVQFGQGPQFAANCPPFPPPPTGYRVWNEQIDGPVPPAAVQDAQALAYNMQLPLGYADTIYVNGIPLIVRVDPHTWTTDAQGNVIAGCYHGATVYTPTAPGQGVTPPNASGGGGSSALITASILLGATASAIALIDRFFGRR
jgi:hypothetical protein